MSRVARRPRLAFRGRVLGSLVALVAGVILVGLFVQRAVLLRRFDQHVVSSLQQERRELTVLAEGTNPTTGEPFDDDVVAIFDTFLARNVPSAGEMFLTFVDGRPHATSLGPVSFDELPAAARRWGALTEGRHGRMATVAGPIQFLAVPLAAEGEVRGVLVVAHFERAERDRIESSIRSAVVAMAAVLVVATFVAWLVAGRLLRPVRELTEAAEAIDDPDVAHRIPVDGDDEIARLARRFNEMLDRLGAAFAAQRAFVDDAGHELRTPITIIQGHLELMGDDPDDRAETVALVMDELDRMTRIVEDLLVLAKSEQPDFVRIEPVESAELTGELFAKARALGDRRWVADGAAEGILDVDAQRLTQAVLNLARNAVEHTEVGTEIALGSAWVDEGWAVWVRDRGAGVAQAEQARIFDRFARGAGGRRSEGAGLGLAIVRSVAEAHGGHARVDSPPGSGATFTIVLPVRTTGAGDGDDEEARP